MNVSEGLTPPGERATARFNGVDVLRGVSIVAVVLLHIWIRFRGAGYDIGASLPGWLARLIFFNGGNGVTIFFAVSGFLITTTSLRRFGSLAEMRPAAFYRIRFARIAPLLLLLLAVLSALHLAHASGFRIPPERATLPRALFAALTFHLNWLEATRGYLPANWDILWSLSIEEMFYLFFPLLCLLLLRMRRGVVLFLGVLLVFVVLGPFGRTIWSATGIAKEKSYLGGMSGIALGCLAALAAQHLRKRSVEWERRHAKWLLACELVGAALIAWIAVWPPWHWMRYIGRSGLDDTLLAIGTCLVMVGSVLRGGAGSRWTAALRWFGRHSYEVYLTHEFVVVWGVALYVRFHRGPVSIWCGAMLLLTAPLGALLARYYSEPLNRWIRGLGGAAGVSLVAIGARGPE